MRIILLLLALTLTQVLAPRPPEAEISSGSVRAKLYLPNAETGYYRGTRFDWSGAIASLEWKGHNYFGQWFEKYDPKLHDAITGPVEEFSSVGYDEAKAGESFVRIGVGAVRKPEEPPTVSSPRMTSRMMERGPSTRGLTRSNSCTSCATRQGTPTTITRRCG